MPEIDDEDGLEARAAQELGGEDGEEGYVNDNTPRCPTCHRPTDNVQDMTEGALLEALRTELLRDLYRKAVAGQMTHQEAAILRGLLRDNNIRVPPKPPAPFEGDKNMPPTNPTRTPLPTRDEFDETDGG